jgi:hypothetical protein
MLKNAKKLPLVLYGLHFAPGVAEYQEAGSDPYRILINENVAKKMDATFVGKPLYVEHVDEVDLENIQNEADGWVLESFFNQLDGKHWVKFILVSDAAQAAYRNGYKLSNAYVPKSFAGGGQWHGVSYVKEVMDGEYEHLALVRDPRYAESVILTSEEFKQYNEQKASELKRLANSKQEKSTMKFSIFRRTRVENSKDVNFEEMEVQLPKSKSVVTLAACIEGFDAIQNMHGYAANEHMVKVNDKYECSVSELVEKHNTLEKELEEMKSKNAGGEGEEADVESMDNGDGVGEEEGDEDLGVEPDADLTKKNDEGEEEMPMKAKKNAGEGPKPLKAAKAKENFDRLKNARRDAAMADAAPIMLTSDKVAVGRARYGSGN